MYKFDALTCAGVLRNAMFVLEFVICVLGIGHV